MLTVMESLAMEPDVAGSPSPPASQAAWRGDIGVPSERASGATRASVVPRSAARPGMSFGHDVLLALIMAVAMAATVFLYR